MTFEVRLTVKALEQLAGYMAEGDAAGLKELVEAIEALAVDPTTGVRWGPFHWRLRVGRYRAVYSWQEGHLIVLVVHVGRTDDDR
ncbi:type II toxin-antitoxin system RelE/ParE family toxin [Streptomyces triticagri]|uniref:Type II toxin-antitoxin system RelE/ParE family toxin n=1 Tax=Streptomyces triticagri TaxID=2293568 RepID=A0A372LUZ1_9ACTN|nr:type II toxin-antitoxin system RelE/ParE family toxin [Streptomyces triticagri]RFU82478.1 type II toxin-antitoxin system RelE/ParE family toxin [Streptomyces triticagri]